VLVWAGMFPSLRNLDRLNAIKVSDPVPVD
jgi:hypothetical protein